MITYPGRRLPVAPNAVTASVKRQSNFCQSSAKPCGLLNILGFYDRLLEFLDHVAAQGFLKKIHREILLVQEDPVPLLRAMTHYRAPTETKWLKPAET